MEVPIYVDIVAKVFVLLGSLLYGATKIIGVDVLTRLTKIRGVHKVFAGVIVASALYLIMNRDFYLPFLGKCVFPSTLTRTLTNTTLHEYKQVSVKISNLPPTTNVVYWAATGGDNTTFDNPMDAYKDFQNSGMAVTNANGSVVFVVDCPSVYAINKFGKRKELPQHVHYRYELPKYKGMFSRIFTKNVRC
jgi:hypothetical protein